MTLADPQSADVRAIAFEAGDLVPNHPRWPLHWGDTLFVAKSF